LLKKLFDFELVFFFCDAHDLDFRSAQLLKNVDVVIGNADVFKVECFGICRVIIESIKDLQLESVGRQPDLALVGVSRLRPYNNII
jgi:hypothetical protein